MMTKAQSKIQSLLRFLSVAGLLTGTLLFSVPSIVHAVTPVSGREGNGGFLFSRTSKKLLDAAQQSLLLELSVPRGAPKPEAYTSTACPKPVDFEKLEESIRTLDATYMDATSGINPDGKEEPRFFQIRDGKIEATREYFSAFVDTYFRYIEETDIKKKDAILTPIRTAIIHEALHPMEYTQLEAEACAPRIEAVIGIGNARKSDLRTLALFQEKCSEQLEYFANHANDSFGGVGVMSFQRLVRCVSEKMSPLRSEMGTNWNDLGQEAFRTWRKGDVMRVVETFNRHIRFPFEQDWGATPAASAPSTPEPQN
jgi:hypothetical protein